MNERLIFIDTETTGLDHEDGHRIVEIGAIVVQKGRVAPKDYFHTYCNPEREIDPGAQAVHGIEREFLNTCPKFGQIAPKLVKFLTGGTVIAHNMYFDEGFLDSELQRQKLPQLKDIAGQVLCTKLMSQARNPNFASHSLDNLCKHYQIDNSRRELHTAVLDAQLLAQVYHSLAGKEFSLDENLHKKIYAQTTGKIREL